MRDCFSLETGRARGKARVAATGCWAGFVGAAYSAMRDPEALRNLGKRLSYLGPAVRKGTKGEVELHNEGPWPNSGTSLGAGLGGLGGPAGPEEMRWADTTPPQGGAGQLWCPNYSCELGHG